MADNEFDPEKIEKEFEGEAKQFNPQISIGETDEKASLESDKPFNSPLPEKPLNLDNKKANEAISLLIEKITSLNEAQDGLIKATNNMIEAFNREERNTQEYSNKINAILDNTEMQLISKLNGLIDEYMGKFVRVTEIGGNNLKKFLKAENIWYEKLAKPITSQSRIIFWLSIINFLILVYLVLKMWRIL